MTDKDIIKALECCADEMGCIKGCPCFDPKAKGSHCKVSKKLELEKLTIDLINRQQAEIERLRKEAEIFADIGKMYSEIRAEAVKDFLYRLKSIPNIVVYKREIDAIAEEMGVRVDG